MRYILESGTAQSAHRVRLLTARWEHRRCKHQQPCRPASWLDTLLALRHTFLARIVCDTTTVLSVELFNSVHFWDTYTALLAYFEWIVVRNFKMLKEFHIPSFAVQNYFKNVITEASEDFPWLTGHFAVIEKSVEFITALVNGR